MRAVEANSDARTFYGKRELEKHLKLNGFDVLTIKNKVLLDDNQGWVTSRKMGECDLV